MAAFACIRCTEICASSDAVHQSETTTEVELIRILLLRAFELRCQLYPQSFSLIDSATILTKCPSLHAMRVYTLLLVLAAVSTSTAVAGVIDSLVEKATSDDSKSSSEISTYLRTDWASY